MALVNDILEASGIKHRHTRFMKPPSGSYAVYMDDISADGADNDVNRVFTHNSTIELYSPTPDNDSEIALETALNNAGVHYTKQDRYWIQDEQLYQTIYEFTSYEKRRNS